MHKHQSQLITLVSEYYFECWQVTNNEKYTEHAYVLIINL